MAIPDVELVVLLTEKYLESAPALTSAERREVVHLAQGFACKESAAADGRAAETIRARRKRIYFKLGMAASRELVSSLLALSLQMLASGERLMPSGAEQVAPVESVLAAEATR
jgi:DNA-binding CsgD family transcriptional regulator